MKTKLPRFFPLALCALFAATAVRATTIDWILESEGFDSDLWSSISSGTSEIVFLTGDDLWIRDGYIHDWDDLNGANDPNSVDIDADYAQATWSDDLDQGDHVRYFVAVKTSDGNGGYTYRALSTDSSDPWSLYVTDDYDPTSGPVPTGDQNINAAEFYNPDDGEGGYESVDYSTYTSDNAPAEQLPVPSISDFAVSGNAAALTATNTVSGAFYAVFSSTTPNGAKTHVETKTASGDTVQFTGLDASASAKFFHVKGGASAQDVAAW